MAFNQLTKALAGLAPKGGKSFASADNLIKQGIVKANKSVSDNAGLMGMVRNLDSSLGGHGQQAMATIRDAAESNNLTRGILADASEFGQVKRTIDSTQKSGLVRGLSEEKALYDHQILARKNYAEALEKAKASNVDDIWNNENVKRAQTHFLTDDMSENGARISLESYTGGDVDDMISLLKEDSAAYLKMSDSLGESISNAQAGFVMQDQNMLEKTLTYFSNSEYGGKRVAATAAAGVGLAVGGRLMSGGTLTRDADGRRDLAGVPFI